jgi:hypothetical protein
MIIVAVLLIVAALLIGWDGYNAYQRYARGKMAPATGAAAAR